MFYLNIKVLFISLFILIGFAWADVGGYVYKDNACGVYGVRESDESGVSDATIKVVDSEGNSQEVNTDDNGSWNSTLNAPVRVELISYDSENLKESPYGENSKTDTQLISENSDEIEFGLYNNSESCGKKGGGLGDKEAIEVGNLVWSDDNFNGIQDAGESGIAGVEVKLYCDGELVSSATTDAQGYYIFSSDTTKDSTDSYKYNIDKLTENNTNNCQVIIEQQDAICDLNATKPNQGDNRAVDSDGLFDGEKVVVNIPDTIVAGDNNHTLDVGFAPCVCIGDFIWFDENKNGIQDSNESGIANVTVNLLNENGEVVETTTTNSDGNYTFCNLHPGEKYYIQVVKPNDNYGFSPKEQGDDDSKDSNLNSDGKSDLITIGECDDDTIDGGLVDNTPKNICIGDFIWLDENKNGIQDSNESGIANVTIKLLNEDGDVVNTTTTNSNGEYQFCGLHEGEKYYIQVVKPNDNYGFSPKEQGGDDSKDSNLNSDGKSDLITIGDSNNDTIDGGLVDNTPQTACIGDFVWLDNNKNGIQDSNESGIANIKVELYKGDTKVSEVNTDANGKYEFCQLEVGDYHIKVIVPTGYTLSPKDIGGDDSKDSDIDPTTKESADTTLESGENDLTWDAGLMPNGNTGGKEHNKSACLGDYMWWDKNLNGIQDSDEVGVVNIKVELYDDSNNLIATTHTDSNGKYLFCELKPGKYRVKFEQPDTYLFTLKDRDDDAKDSDVDDSGWSQVVELSSGSNNLTIDAGVYCECNDYKVHPDDYKEVSAEISVSSMLLTLIFTVIMALLLRRKRG